MNLFIDPTLFFEKCSSAVTLAEDPNGWPDEILQELFKQVPYIADFSPHVEMDRVDAERGYAFGCIEIMNRSEIQHGASPEGLEAAGVKQAKIPIVVNNRKLQPFDVLITEDDKMLPLTEERLRQAIFRPSAFDITARTPGDTSMIGQLYPPFRQNYGGGSGASMSVGMGKMGAAECCPKCNKEKCSCGYMAKQAHSVLFNIIQTANQTDHDAFTNALTDKNLQAAFVKNAEAAYTSLEIISSYSPVPVTKTASALLKGADAFSTIVQVTQVGDGYAVKTASHRFWNPSVEVWDRGQVVRTFGEKIALDADLNGQVTMAPEASAVAEPEKDEYQLIKDFGIYKVKTEDGKEIIGYVFPNLLDVDGTPLPICLFTNGSQAGLQGEIAGINVGGGASLFEGHPRGEGVFYELLSNGRAQATVPLTIQASMSSPEEGGVTLSAVTFDGRTVSVKVQPNINKIVLAGETILVPDTMRWLPLDKADEVSIIGDPEQANAVDKVASRKELHHVYVRGGGHNNFSITGPAVMKLASEEKSFIDYDDTIFLLGALGTDLTYATQKLAEASLGNAPVEVAVKYALEMPQDRIAEAQKVASKNLAKVPNLRVSLVKEAAVIPDPVAVDTVLSLGFINPENMMTFVSYLPTLDEAQKRMCELLIASRLGLKDIPTSALERAIRSLEEIISGLKVLALQKN